MHTEDFAKLYPHDTMPFYSCSLEGRSVPILEVRHLHEIERHYLHHDRRHIHTMVCKLKTTHKNSHERDDITLRQIFRFDTKLHTT